MRIRLLEIIVGCFMLAGLVALLVLAFTVSGFAPRVGNHSYTVTANFDNVGDLKVRAPVTIAGVHVGEVTKITLDKDTFRAHVRMKIADTQDKIPYDSAARILTQGLLGSNYVSIEPGYGDESGDNFLKGSSVIEETHPALILENLIGQFLFNIQKDDKK